MKDSVRQRLKENSEENYDKVRLEMLSMMSIEERAIESYHQRGLEIYNLKHSFNGELFNPVPTFEDGYKRGATEQKAIDDKEFMEESLKMLKEERDEMIGKAIQYWDARLRELKQEIREGYDITRPKELIDFKKAMED